MFFFPPKREKPVREKETGKESRAEKMRKGLFDYEVIPHHFPASFLIRLPKKVTKHLIKRNTKSRKAWAHCLE